MPREMPMGVIVYDSNNSGGSWWLSDDDWEALEGAGWVVHWIHDEDDSSHVHERGVVCGWLGHSHADNREDLLIPATPNGDTWVGARARSAAKGTDDPDAAIAEFERITGALASDEGCNCCGPPHSFTYTDDQGEQRTTSVDVVATKLRWS